MRGYIGSHDNKTNKCVKLGAYEHVVEVKNPNTNKTIYVDKCILPDIEHLWSLGIKTGGCCCGHGNQKASVAVCESSIKKMLELGYKQDKRYKEGHVFDLK